MTSKIPSPSPEPLIKADWNEFLEERLPELSINTQMSPTQKNTLVAEWFLNALTSFLIDNRIGISEKLAKNWRAWRDHFANKFINARTPQQGIQDVTDDFNAHAGGFILPVFNFHPFASETPPRKKNNDGTEEKRAITHLLQNGNRLLVLLALGDRQMSDTEVMEHTGLSLEGGERTLQELVQIGCVDEYKGPEKATFRVKESIVQQLEELRRGIAIVFRQAESAHVVITEKENGPKEIYFAFIESLNETRRTILECIIQNGGALRDLSNHLQFAPAKLNHHLEEMKIAGLITKSKGNNSYELPEGTSDVFRGISEWLLSLKDKDGNNASAYVMDAPISDELSSKSAALWDWLSANACQIIDSLNGAQLSGYDLNAILKFRTSHTIKTLLQENIIYRPSPRKLSISPNFISHAREIASWFSRVADKIDAKAST